VAGWPAGGKFELLAEFICTMHAVPRARGAFAIRPRKVAEVPVCGPDLGPPEPEERCQPRALEGQLTRSLRNR